MARNYSSIYNMKDFAIKEVAPKYFSNHDINEFNLGLLGYTTELIGTVTEDSFNTVSAYTNEIFPNLAVMPESIFNYSALFNMSGDIGTPAKTTIYLFVSEEDIIRYGTRQGLLNSWDFYLDSDMVIDIEGVRFKPDYDIRINRKRDETNTGKYIYTASYYRFKYGGAYTNTISDITNDYIKSRIIRYQNVNYLQLEIIAHQVDKYYMNENIINSDIINLPTYSIEYDGILGNFEVFYRAPNDTSFIQLKKQLLGSGGDKTSKFCYYKIVDDNKLEISFSSRDGYFHPEYNSEINIEYYTTTGSAGNFEAYTGTTIAVYPESTQYTYNNSIFLFAIPMTSASGGDDPLTIEELRTKVVERFSTVNSFSNENDLMLYFSGINASRESKIYFIKKRDDIFERLFSAFSILKNKDNVIYSTNTLNAKLRYGYNNPDDTDIHNDTIKPGTKFVYNDNLTSDTIRPVHLNEEVNDTEFVYINPFLMKIFHNPLSIGYYLNSVDDEYVLDHEKTNSDSIIQFICGSLSVYRNAISDENYKISIKTIATSELPIPMIIPDLSIYANRYTITETEDGRHSLTLLNIDGSILLQMPDAKITYNSEGTPISAVTNIIKTKFTITKDNADVKDYYMELDVNNSDPALGLYTFTTEIPTTDTITSNIDMDYFTIPGLEGTLIPIKDVIVKISTEYNNIETNTYISKTNPITFVKPLGVMHSVATYVADEVGDYDEVLESSMMINSLPLVSASLINNPDEYMNFITLISQQHEDLQAISKLETNNYSIDLKFYNTYGRSKNFRIGNADAPLIDRVNIKLHFDIHPVFGTDINVLIRELKVFIKSYVENLNSGTTNSIYISNLIREIETNFKEIEYLRFKGINEYKSIDTQTITNHTVDLTKLTRDERIAYVPEYLTLALDDIMLTII